MRDKRESLKNPRCPKCGNRILRVSKTESSALVDEIENNTAISRSSDESESEPIKFLRCDKCELTWESASEYRKDLKENQIFWITKEGRFIKPEQMSDTHLSNTIRLITRGAILRAELAINGSIAMSSTINGEMAAYEVDNCIDEMITDTSLWEDYTPGIFKAMKREARRRGIDPFYRIEEITAMMVNASAKILSLDKE